MDNPTVKNPRIGVGGVLIHAGHVLLIKRSKPPLDGHWSLPGGKLEYGESIERALVREIQEETGLVTEPCQFLDIVEWIDESHHYVLIDWLMKLENDMILDQLPYVQAASDARDARFFKVEDALNLPLWQETRRLIEKARDLCPDQSAQN